MSQPTASLTCPKCHADMRTYERSGIHVDQCTECRGIFLDRGELERLVDAETSFHQPVAAAPAAAAPRYQERPRHEQRPRYEERKRYDDHGQQYHGQQYHGQQYHGRKKKSFFSELFDD